MAMNVILDLVTFPFLTELLSLLICAAIRLLLTNRKYFKRSLSIFFNISPLPLHETIFSILIIYSFKILFWHFHIGFTNSTGGGQLPTNTQYSTQQLMWGRDFVQGHYGKCLLLHKMLYRNFEQTALKPPMKTCSMRNYMASVYLLWYVWKRELWQTWGCSLIIMATRMSFFLAIA